MHLNIKTYPFNFKCHPCVQIIAFQVHAYISPSLPVDKYDINNEQSYTKLGYYLQSEEHYNIGRAHVLENYVFDDYKHYEIYKILKWL